MMIQVAECVTEMVKMPKSNRFYPDTFEKAQVWPVQASISADQARFERLCKETKEITSLYNMAVRIGSSLNLEEVIWAIYKESGRLMDTTNFAIVTYDDQADMLNFALVFDQGQRVTSRLVNLAGNRGLPARVLASQSPFMVRDFLENGPIKINPSCPDKKIRSWLGVPIRNPMLPYENTQGVIATWSYEPNAFSDHDLWLLSAIGTQAAIAIRNACLHETILAERDRVIETEEQTRKALARDLHDGPTQLVSAMAMRLDFCKMALEKDPTSLPKEIVALQDLAQRTVREIRTLLFELRPLALETQGLTAAVQIFIERRQKDMIEDGTKLTLEIKTDHPNNEIPRQDDKVEAALFAVIQETINNALKHAQADNIVVKLRETGAAIYAIISDDGNGFEVDQVMRSYEQRSSLGMVNIYERTELIGGKLTLRTSLGQGTRIVVQVPKAKEERMKRRGATKSLSPLFNLILKQ